MVNASNPAVAEVAQCVRSTLQGVLHVRGAHIQRKSLEAAIADSAVLAGTPDALLDSLALVMFLSELEQEVQHHWGVSVDLFGEVLDQQEGALTLQSLTAYLHGAVRDSFCHSVVARERQ